MRNAGAAENGVSAGVTGRTEPRPGRALAAPGRGAGGPPGATSAPLLGRRLHARTQQQGLDGRWRSSFFPL